MRLGKPRKSQKDEEDEIIRKIDELMRDPERFREYIEERADKLLKGWHKG